jgi:transcriptional regulator with XRE-family HTH domain
MSLEKQPAGPTGRELGAFLRARRERIVPAERGLPAGDRRRVKGLRREELALLAGVSVDYYVRLEQGRASNPSDEILDAVARVLDLDDLERAHLRDLARPPRRGGGNRAGSGADQADPMLRALLEAIGQSPAVVVDRCLVAVAWNPLLAAAYPWIDFAAADPRERNFARFAFLDPRAADVVLNWDDNARSVVGDLRRAAGRDPEDAELAALIGELSMKSEAFRRMWAAGDVRELADGAKWLAHPLVGELRLHSQAFEIPASGGRRPGQRLVVLFPPPGSAGEDALRLLGSWTAPEHDAAGRDQSQLRTSGRITDS